MEIEIGYLSSYLTVGFLTSLKIRRECEFIIAF